MAVPDPIRDPVPNSPLVRAALAEVIDLHVFFEAWLGGTTAKEPAAFSRLDRALAEQFTLVAPGGERLRRPAVIEGLRGAHGARPAPFRITIREPELLCLRPPLVILGYIEEQSAGATLTRRRSTAVFESCADEDARQGVRWLALHETWIAPGA
jgi:hypothetical protein